MLAMAELPFPPRIDAMGECGLLVTLGRGISAGVDSRVHLLAVVVREAQIRGVRDIVPTYASVLVTFEPEICSEEALRGHLLRLLDGLAAAPEATSHTVEIPVSYGGESGPDLADVATLHGLTPGEVVALHTAPLYRVYFLGFMPGFPYMGGLDPRIATPRLPAPRVRVPVGSVGIAGEQTGVYPFDSPGGWRLIGRTAVPMWDSGRDSPTFLLPGDHVRFRQTAELVLLAPPLESVDSSLSGGVPTFEVIQPGGLTLVQDLGRPGYAHLGLSAGGAMDPQAPGLANRLVGNPAGHATLELTWSGPTLRAIRTTVIALAGADMGCTVDDRSVPPGISWLVRAGSIVRFGKAATDAGGMRAYLAVAGGISVPVVLGSRSTYLPARIGGLYGRALRTGDTLKVGEVRRSMAELAGKLAPASTTTIISHTDAVLRFVRYRGEGAATNAAIDHLLATTFTVSEASDRMGTRLVPAERGTGGEAEGEVVSFGVVRGAIQLPPGGVPLVLGADHQTTGGYPLVGVMARVDWPVLAGLRPGQAVRLTEIDREEARRAYAERRRELAI